MAILKVTFSNVNSDNYDVLVDHVALENMTYSLTREGNETYSIIFDQTGHGDRVKRIIGEVVLYTSIIVQSERLAC